MICRSLLMTLAALLLIGCTGKSLETDVLAIDDTSAEAPSISWFSRIAIDTWLRYQVWSGTRSGFVVLLARDGQPVYATTAGWADIESETPMQMNTRMRFASMTKPVIAVAAHMLIEEGKLSLDDRVDSFIPEFADARVATSHNRDSEGQFPTIPADPIMQVRHLLMFASGVGPGYGDKSELIDLWQANGARSHAFGTMQERVAHLGTLPLFENPGSRWRYGWSADVLASIIEIVSQRPLDEFLQQRIFDPLQMTQTHYRYADPKPEELATVYTQDEGGELIVSHPDSDVNYPEGGSGLVSTAEDYMRFALMLYNSGEYRGARLLKKETIDHMTELHVPSGVLASEGIEGLGWGLGMQVVADAEKSLLGDADGDYGWSGYFGTTFWVSPATGMVGVVLSQNEPGPYSGQPIGVYVVPNLALMGL